jgi:hypothetical protein
MRMPTSRMLWGEPFVCPLVELLPNLRAGNNSLKGQLTMAWWS